MMTGHCDFTRYPLLLRASVEIVVTAVCLDVVEGIRKGFDDKFLDKCTYTVCGIQHSESYGRIAKERLLFRLGQCHIESRGRVSLGKQTGRVWK